MNFDAEAYELQLQGGNANNNKAALIRAYVSGIRLAASSQKPVGYTDGIDVCDALNALADRIEKEGK